MPRHAVAGALVAAWLLLFNADPDDRHPQWRPVGTFASETHCEYGRTGESRRTAEERIGSALANQPQDNPMRREAFSRAYQRAQTQYRCVSQ